MGYINSYKLIQSIVEGRKPDAKSFLEEVDKERIYTSLKNSKDGIPKDFSWTDEPVEERGFAKLPWEIKRKINKSLQQIRTNPQGQIPVLLQLRTKYPQVPVILNYLAVAYHYSKQINKYQEALHDTVRLFPYYLFGKISLAEFHLNNDNHKEVKKIFEKKLEIYFHYPKAQHIFHISEVRSFYSVIGIFYARSGKIARSIYCYFILKQIDSSHPAALKLGDEIIFKELLKIRRNFNKPILN